MGDQLSYSAKAGRLLRLLGWLMAVATVLFVIAATTHLVDVYGTDEFTSSLVGFYAGVILVLVLIVALYFWVGNAMKANNEWARFLAIILSLLSLFNFPIGTFISVFVFYYLARGGRESS